MFSVCAVPSAPLLQHVSNPRIHLSPADVRNERHEHQCPPGLVVQRQDRWHPGSDSKKFANVSVLCSEVELGALSLRIPTFADVTDVPGLGISQSLANFDEILRYVSGSISVVGLRVPI